MAIELTGERVRVREWREDDAERVWALVRDQDGLLSRPGDIASFADAEEWVVAQIALQKIPERTQYRLAVERIEDEVLLGGARIHIEDATHRQASLGYALHHTHWGKGYATEAATLMLKLAFEHLSVHRVEALVDPSNERSRRVVTKLRFRPEGHMKGRFFERNQWFDADVFAITEDEWRAR